MTAHSKIIKRECYFMEVKDIILRISYFRNKENISARELSLRIGKNETYINRLESKSFNLSITALLEIIDALNVTCDEFFADNFMTYKKDKKIDSIFKDLSPENKDMIINLIKNLK